MRKHVKFMSEYAKVYHVDNRKARKKHKCFECEKVIEIGEVYKYHHGVGDVGFSEKVCVECEIKRDKINKYLPFGELVRLGELEEYLREIEL